ncbi:hypothetical protein [Streptosporangium sp. KLBMP 9127]|nr:hypothetical protein [Streptosporangium sp. KLBMP 9127]
MNLTRTEEAMGHNLPVAHDHSSRYRISPSVIARAVWDDTNASFVAAKIAAGALAGLLVAFLFAPALHGWTLALGLIAGTIVGLTVNGAQILQLNADRISRRDRVVRGLFRYGPKQHEVALAHDLQAGDWICSAKEYEKQCEYLNGTNRKRKDDFEQALEREDYYYQRELAEYEELDREHRIDRPHPRKRHVQEPYYYGLPEPDTCPIVTIRPIENGARLKISRHGKELLFLDRNAECHRRLNYNQDNFALSENSVEPSRAVVDLLCALSAQRQLEADVVARLIAYGHSRPHVSQAVRAVLVAGLASRDRDLRSRFLEVEKLFSLSSKAAPRRDIWLTSLGELWKDADDYAATEKKGAQLKQEFNISGGNWQGNSFGSGSVFYNANPDSNIRNVLQQIVSVLDSRENLFREMEGEQELRQAVEIIRAAANLENIPQSRLRQALSIVLNTGGALIIGMAGNGLYEQAKAILETMGG